jgi:hypothetical protein
MRRPEVDAEGRGLFRWVEILILPRSRIKRVVDDITNDTLCIFSDTSHISHDGEMAKLEDIIAAMRAAPGNVRFADLRKVCAYYFGPARQEGTSHCVYRTPWPGDPRVNIQAGKGGKAKDYQVRQVIQAIDKMESMSNGN